MIFCARATRGRGLPSLGLMARLGVPVGGRVRKLRAVEDQSAPIPGEKTSKLGGIIYIVRCAQQRAVVVVPLKRDTGESPWLHSDVKTMMMYIHVLNLEPRPCGRSQSTG